MNAEKIRLDPSQVDTSGYDRVPDDEQIARQTEDLVLPDGWMERIMAEPDLELRAKLIKVSGAYKRSPESV